ncbi:hypothetical protein PARPLA_02697 [Rhodobacteraceae bacterium THAF1]|uniref:DUF4394 domain-containing protein n=1 Tax=Palleronia sp. THAF1 TaxID=2587842 RepID=UPI000F3D0C69|nr:DUF4394 domain-containing protein [Palleronia sp. THAF1]QFU08689.1 hypothetical protein FIU81_08385 [Palleronia sp. THAF1]VDC28436.1 hypothetical protein PARPLA_02697 [Rhodobacteraceae bacterium THAF1]
MTYRILTTASILALSTAGAHAAGHAGNMGYALADDGATLVVMADIASPADLQTFELASPVDAIAWRPVTGELLGITNGMVGTIDPMSGEMTDLEASFGDDATLSGDAVAFDFNNAIDAVRALSTGGDNLVYFPVGFGDNDDRANTVVRMTDLAYAEGDDNADATPMVFANAYTNAINGETAGSTFQYGIDAETDSLVSVANNEGTLETIGAITVDGEEVDVAPMGGFDIVSPSEDENAAYAILQMEGADNAGLYMIDTDTGAATMLADLGMGGFSGFAVSMPQ